CCCCWGWGWEGPFDTLRSTWAPFCACVPPPGDCETTVSCGCVLGTRCTDGTRPALPRSACAEPSDRPVTSGILTGDGAGGVFAGSLWEGVAACVGPFETFSRTPEPWSTFVPPAGCWLTTVLLAWSLGTNWTSAFRPWASRVCTASAWDWPTRSGV